MTESKRAGKRWAGIASGIQAVCTAAAEGWRDYKPPATSSTGTTPQVPVAGPVDDSATWLTPGMPVWAPYGPNADWGLPPPIGLDVGLKEF